VDPSTLKDKVMVGYQGWFRTPNDLPDSGWVHWGNLATQPPGYTIDMWPDPAEVDPQDLVRAATIRTRSGREAWAFSSTSPGIIRTHFKWMRRHNIDGAFLQRFLQTGGQGSDGRPEWVLNGVRESANRKAAFVSLRPGLIFR
jgi:hypothetical protein